MSRFEGGIHPTKISMRYPQEENPKRRHNNILCPQHGRDLVLRSSEIFPFSSQVSETPV